MKHFTVTLSLGPLLFLMAECVAADAALTVHANEAAIQLEPRDESQRQISLPTLDLSLTASFSCEADGEAESLTVSVLDTHTRYGRDDIAGAASVDAVLRVPATQFSPIAIPDFCIIGTSADDKGLLIPGIASAQVSLRCRGGAGLSSVHFASATFPLRLGCSPDQVQDSSTDR